MLRKGSDLPKAAVGTKPLPDSRWSASPPCCTVDRRSLQGGELRSPHAFPPDPRPGAWATLSKPPPCSVSPLPWSPPVSAQQPTLSNVQQDSGLRGERRRQPARAFHPPPNQCPPPSTHTPGPATSVSPSQASLCPSPASWAPSLLSRITLSGN